MMQDFKSEKLDQLVRGQVDDLAMVEEGKKLFGIDPKLKRIDMALVRDDFNREWFLTGASNPDLQTLEEKIRVSTQLSKWLKETFKIKPKIAVMATCRPGSYGKDPVMSQTFDEAEAVVKHLKNWVTTRKTYI
jgi:predicted methyltransferase MtxX (methanogen marker protein 4)